MPPAGFEDREHHRFQSLPCFVFNVSRYYLCVFVRFSPLSAMMGMGVVNDRLASPLMRSLRHKSVPRRRA